MLTVFKLIHHHGRALAAALCILSLCQAEALAAVASVDVSPKNTAVAGQARISLTLPANAASSNTPIGSVARIAPLQLSPGSFRANWRLVCANTGDSATSAHGEFILDGTVIALTGGLSEPICTPAGSVRPENVTIPPEVVSAVEARIRALPVRAFNGRSVTDAFSVYYRRAFRDTTGPVRADQVNIVFRIVVSGDVREATPEIVAEPPTPAAPVLPPFELTRVDLAFDDGSRLKVDDADTTRHLVATLNYHGTGFLRATWEVAPVIAGGRPLFRPLPAGRSTGPLAPNAAFDLRETRTVVREYLGQFQRVALQSPPLPDQPGRYLVRLNIDSPTAQFALPILEYLVGNEEGETTPALEPVAMRLSLADPTAGLTPDAELRWEPVGLTRAYRYEIYAGETGDDMITGAVFPATRLAAGLSPLVMERLVPGNAYRVRVVAIDGEGRVHGESEFIETRYHRP